jgi:HlyD family secretion protein
MQSRRIFLPLAAIAAAFIMWRAWGTGPDDSNVLPGYLEGETLFMAAPISGTVKSIAVTRGQRIEAGAPLFAMDSSVLAAERSRAEAQLRQAEAQVAVTQAKAQQAEANALAAAAQAEKARADLDRYLRVQRVDRAAIAQEQVDTARTTAANARAQYDAAENEAKAENLQVSASEGQVAQFQAALADVQARFDQLSPRAPSPARVLDVFYQPGEWATANQPVVSLLPDDKLKVRFFVSETQVARFRLGETVKFACDGCATGLTARINYISPQPEFTPPVIYSRKSRDRLVFLVEALPTDARKLTPGLPVEVTPLSNTADHGPDLVSGAQ